MSQYIISTNKQYNCPRDKQLLNTPVKINSVYCILACPHRSHKIYGLRSNVIDCKD